MKKYRYILFDWDGTLAKTLDIWLEALRASLKEHNYAFSDKEMGADFKVFKQWFESEGHTNSDKILLKAGMQADENIPKVRLYPNAHQTLKHLHDSGKRLALVTTSLHAQIDPLLKLHKLQLLFDAVVCGDDTDRIKPDPQPVLEALRLLNAESSETLMIGDSEKDILAAQAAGIDSMLFYPRSHDKFHDIENLKLYQPTYIIHGLSDLIHLL